MIKTEQGGGSLVTNCTVYVHCLCFQVPHLNKNAWNNLEKYSRSLARNNKNVYVCTGPLYLPR